MVDSWLFLIYGFEQELYSLDTFGKPIPSTRQIKRGTQCEMIQLNKNGFITDIENIKKRVLLDGDSSNKVYDDYIVEVKKIKENSPRNGIQIYFLTYLKGTTMNQPGKAEITGTEPHLQYRIEDAYNYQQK